MPSYSEATPSQGHSGPGTGQHVAALYRLAYGKGAQAFLLEPRDQLIGRAPQCDVLLHEPSVSREHARLAWDGEGFAVEDLDSRNGVVVDGARVTRARLRSGCVIELGSAALRFTLLGDEVPASPTLHRTLDAVRTPIAAALHGSFDAVGAVLDQLPMGVVLLDVAGRAVLLNRCARELLDQRDGIALENGGLRAWDDGAQRTLQRLLREAADGGAVCLPRPSLRRPYSVLVAPLDPGGPMSPAGSAVSVAFIGDPERPMASTFETLSRFYQLTPAETSLATALAQGKSLKEIAADLDITVETARTHLKRIFLKTGTRRQSELVCLLLTGPGVL